MENKNKVIVITGCTSGIGAATVKSLCGKGHELVLLVRNPEKAGSMFSCAPYQGHTHIIACDLEDMESIKKAAEEVRARFPHIDVLINNAGGVCPTREVSKDGFEKQFAMNHLGHFFLTQQLMDILKSSNARIINVSSAAHSLGKLDFDDLQLEKDFTPIKAYSNAKLANIYFTKELNRRYADEGVTAYALHPGVVDTGFGSTLKGPMKWGWKLMKPFLRKPEDGASTSVYLATEPDIEKLSGNYFKNSKVAKPAAVANDTQAAGKLWELSERYTEPFF